MRYYILLATIISLSLGSQDLYTQDIEPPVFQVVEMETEYGETEEDIFEAVFRFMIDHNASAAQRNTNYYFFELMDRDPDQTFLERFKDITPSVVAASNGNASKDSSIINKNDKKRGIIFSIAGYNKKEDGSYLVYGGYYEGNLSSSGCTYTVKLIDGLWKVTERVVNMISRIEWDNKSSQTTPAKRPLFYYDRNQINPQTTWQPTCGLRVWTQR